MTSSSKSGFLLIADKVPPGTTLSMPFYKIVATKPVAVEVFPGRSEIGVTRCVVDSVVVQTTKRQSSRVEKKDAQNDAVEDSSAREHLIEVVRKLREMDLTGK